MAAGSKVDGLPGEGEGADDMLEVWFEFSSEVMPAGPGSMGCWRRWAGVLALTLMFRGSYASGQATPSVIGDRPIETLEETLSSTYVPVDSWVYPAVLRLYSLGYVPSTFLGMRPWTRSTVAEMLRLSQDAIVAARGDAEAQGIYDSLLREFRTEAFGLQPPVLQMQAETVYGRVTGVHGALLNDSLHAGQTFINDYGRPFQPGVNGIVGFSDRAEAGRFSLYFRGEYQHAPTGTGYTPDGAAQLAAMDLTPDVPQSTIPLGAIPATNHFAILEANLSGRLLNHEISFGKSDAWLGPAQGASMAWSNNAEDIYSFRINRVEPLRVPGLSRLIGPVKYDFFVGTLKGHAYPNAPWVHSEKFSFKPTQDLEFGFQRTVIWGGKGHVPITIGTFLRGFFSPAGVQPDVKLSRLDPGARFTAFDFSYRLPYLRKYVTIYTDSTAHDDVFPISAPGRSGFHPGVYVAQIPGARKLDLRAEAALTDVPDINSIGGRFLYWEYVERQGYTNKGFLLGDWIGREAKGGQAWLTYHVSGDQWIQAEYRNMKVAKDFVPGGTTQHDFGLRAVLRPAENVELNAFVQAELWKVPLYMPGAHRDFTGALEVTYYPHRLFRTR